MAVSAVDLRILGAIAEDVLVTNALLSSCLFQILGLSVILSQQLTRARSQRRLDYTRDTKSIKLYHHIIWLAREGLSITEVFILPYCQDGEQGPECRVMAAKMRASFYHIFCLFHNHPPVFQIQHSPKQDVINLRPPLPQNSSIRDSLVSEGSYITNPFSLPAQSPPPRYPIPPLPTTPARTTPARPPGFSPQQPSPPSSASYLLPPLNFVPKANTYFKLASTLAARLLPGANPLRLSVAHEYTAFLSDCAKDTDSARRTAGDAVRAAYSDQTDLSDKEWEDVLMMVKALTGIAQRRTSDQGSGTTKSSPQTEGQPTPTPSGPRSVLQNVRTRVSDNGAFTPRSATLVNSPATAVYDPEGYKIGEFDGGSRNGNGHGGGSADGGARRSSQATSRSQASSRSSRRGRQEGMGTEKERKRRAVERAESDLSRKNSELSRLSETSNATARRI